MLSSLLFSLVKKKKKKKKNFLKKKKKKKKDQKTTTTQQQQQQPRRNIFKPIASTSKPARPPAPAQEAEGDAESLSFICTHRHFFFK